jgi:hypothetical protein
MAKKKKKMGRPELGKMTIAVRLQPETKAMLDRAVKAINASASADSLKMDKSTYIENLLLAKFKRDGIT